MNFIQLIWLSFDGKIGFFFFFVSFHVMHSFCSSLAFSLPYMFMSPYIAKMVIPEIFFNAEGLHFQSQQFLPSRKQFISGLSDCEARELSGDKEAKHKSSARSANAWAMPAWPATYNNKNKGSINFVTLWLSLFVDCHTAIKTAMSVYVPPFSRTNPAIAWREDSQLLAKHE